MARKKAALKPQETLELIVSYDEAQEKLSIQIGKGQAIQDTPINSQQDLDSAHKAFEIWDDFNRELLKRLFTTQELSDSYDAGYAFSLHYDNFLDDRINDFRKGVGNKINKVLSIKTKLELIPSSESTPTVTTLKQVNHRKVFIVHGHDTETKTEVARFIQKIGFEPIILHEQANGSKTIIEKIETYSDVGFGVVIYTPCDVGAKSSEQNNLQSRARQNVVFEHGFLIGKLGRENVCTLVKGNLETPNDISGIVYTPMDTVIWQLELAKELREAGYDLDMNKVI